jgi:hypothetical protein
MADDQIATDAPWQETFLEETFVIGDAAMPHNVRCLLSNVAALCRQTGVALSINANGAWNISNADGEGFGIVNVTSAKPSACSSD